MRNVRREIQDFERFEEILRILASNGFKDIITRLELQHYLPVTDKYVNPEPTPERFRETVEELGTVFIKFGQMLAQRKDLIPEKYTEELKKLENDVPPFDSETAREIIDEDIGMDNFNEFVDEPIASASIAQVHKAKLDNGDEVAVKVRRPGLVEQVKKDLDILMFFAKEYDKHGSMGHEQGRRDVEEFKRWTLREIDLRNEAKNAETLKENLSDEPKIRIPKVYRYLTSSRVLVTEYIDAVRVDNVDAIEERDIEFEEIARIGVRSQLKQIFRDGFFHADPHPSNFLVDSEGNLVYLDFGIMGKLTPKKRRLVSLMFYYQVEQDVDGLMSIFEELGYKEDDYERENLRSEFERTVLELKGSTLEDSSFAKSFAKLSLKAGQNGLYIPNDLIVMGKGFTIIEGIGLDVYPEYNFEEENYQDLKNLIREQFDPEDAAKDFAVDVLRNRDKLTKSPSKLLNSDEDDSQNITVVNKSGESNLVPAALIAGSTVLLFQTLPTRTMVIVGGLELMAAAYFLR